MGPGRRHAAAPATARKRLAVTSGGTIPDRGLFGVFLPDGTRVGELDEEMVYESRPGETFLLGASTWRIEDITFERVDGHAGAGRSRARCRSGTATGPGRPLELGRALGAFVREIRELSPAARRSTRLRDHYGLDAFAADNVVQYLDEQAEATGVVPDDRTIVVERFRDEIGDWRVCVLSPFGTPVHAPWAMAIERRLIDRYDMPVETMWSDDGIVLRLPEAADELPDRRAPDRPRRHRRAGRRRRCRRRRCSRRGSGSAPAGRCCCRAAVPIGARRCGSSASGPPTCWRWPPSTRRSRSCSRPSRECLQDVFDVPALREVLGQLRSRDGARGQRRHAEGVAVRAEPAVQLDRRLHVRGRRAARRAAGRGAGARP